MRESRRYAPRGQSIELGAVSELFEPEIAARLRALVRPEREQARGLADAMPKQLLGGVGCLISIHKRLTYVGQVRGGSRVIYGSGG